MFGLPKRKLRATQSSWRRPFPATALQLESLESRYLLTAAPYGQLPLAFEPNVGQAALTTDYLAHGAGYALALSAEGLSFVTKTGAAVDLRIVGANPNAHASASAPLGGVANYLVGSDPDQWHQGVPMYGRVTYHGVYPGVDIAYYGNQGRLEYDLDLAPGAQAGVIQLQVRDAQSLTLDASGSLAIHTASGTLTENAPVAYQERAGTRIAVAARYVIEENGFVGVAVGAYDQAYPLVIDPVLDYSTYLGGAGADSATAIAVDSAGQAYVVGSTASGNFPTAAPLQGAPGGNGDAFVAKLNAAGTDLVFCTYLGGNGVDSASGVAVDSAGHVYLSGNTTSTNFPIAQAFQAHAPGAQNAFVSELDPTGAHLVYSTYLGGADSDAALAIAVDAAGNAYVTGQTGSSDFPTTTAAFQRNHGVNSDGDSNQDAFVTKLSPSGTPVYSTYLGGAADDEGLGIAVDSFGAAYVAGQTTSGNFPAAAPVDPALSGRVDAFLSKLNPAGSALVYSTFLGGSGTEAATGVAVDSQGSAYLAGWTTSTNFPLVAPVQAQLSGAQDAFLTKFNGTGTQIVYSTYLGGSGTDAAGGVAVDSGGAAYVVGTTGSRNFPTVAPVQAASGGGNDAFVARFNGRGVALTYATYLGGLHDENGNAIAVDGAGNAYVAGTTQSSNFPTAGLIQPANAGAGDAFVSKLGSSTWRATDVTVASSGVVSLLWDSPPGRADVWSITGGTVVAGPSYGPLGGWVARATAAGSDGLTRLLWTSFSGAAALWLLDPSGALVSARVFGPFAGWNARDISVGPDAQTHVLWTNTNGQAIVWSVDAAFNVQAGPLFGPYAGWTAQALATGSDGDTRLLWTQPNGAAALWTLDTANQYVSAGYFGAIAGWTATDIAVGPDGNTRLLWASTTGQASVWNVTPGYAATAVTFGPFSGWTPVRLADGADGAIRLLWDNLNGAAALWNLAANGSFQSALTFGPF